MIKLVNERGLTPMEYGMIRALIADNFIRKSIKLTVVSGLIGLATAVVDTLDSQYQDENVNSPRSQISSLSEREIPQSMYFSTSKRNSKDNIDISTGAIVFGGLEAFGLGILGLSTRRRIKNLGSQVFLKPEQADQSPYERLQ